MNEEEVINIIEEQIGKSNIKDYDPPKTLSNKFQREPAKLRKQGKFDSKIYYKVYQSHAIPARLCEVIKVHKPEKHYPMRTIVSTIGTVPYSTSYLVEIIQTTSHY